MSGLMTTNRWAGNHVLLLALFFLAACDGSHTGATHDAHGHAGASEEEAEGAHGGRLLHSGDFALELAVFERGSPPEFRAWATKSGKPIDPASVRLEVTLNRLGGDVENITFAPEPDFLRGDTVLAEPHSFRVSVEAAHGEERYAWTYDHFEGRTHIAPPVAEELGIQTAVAGGATLEETLPVYGKVRANPERTREIRARFDGVVRAVYAELGSVVSKGDTLLRIESNESLNPYTIKAPIGGVVTQRDANPGEQTSSRLLMTVMDTSSVWADLSVFPSDRNRVKAGNLVSVAPADGGPPVSGTISALEVVARPDQSVVARAVLDNPGGRLIPGTFATAEITVATHPVPLAVKREALQEFRDSTVVFAKVGEWYEVRMPELGRRSKEWVEVLGGLDPGTQYVVTNSYIVKADIEKSGAAHAH